MMDKIIMDRLIMLGLCMVIFTVDKAVSAIKYVKSHTPDYISDALSTITDLCMQFGLIYFTAHTISVAVPAILLINNRQIVASLKLITGQSEIEEDESLLNTLQKEANAKIISMMKEHQARCLDHAEDLFESILPLCTGENIDMDVIGEIYVC